MVKRVLTSGDRYAQAVELYFCKDRFFLPQNDSIYEEYTIMFTNVSQFLDNLHQQVHL